MRKAVTRKALPGSAGKNMCQALDLPVGHWMRSRCHLSTATDPPPAARTDFEMVRVFESQSAHTYVTNADFVFAES